MTPIYERSSLLIPGSLYMVVSPGAQLAAVHREAACLAIAERLSVRYTFNGVDYVAIGDPSSVIRRADDDGTEEPHPMERSKRKAQEADTPAAFAAAMRGERSVSPPWDRAECARAASTAASHINKVLDVATRANVEPVLRGRPLATRIGTEVWKMFPGKEAPDDLLRGAIRILRKISADMGGGS